jgi:hypothetical protein
LRLLTGIAALLLATGTTQAARAAENDYQKYQKEYRIACENEYSRHAESKAEAAQMQAEIENCLKRAKTDPESVPGWWTDCRHGWITKGFKKEELEEAYSQPPVEVSDNTVRISYDELRKLVKELPFILRKVKACDAYRKCLDDRDTGKVKHCYANDRRWREFYTGAW